MGIMFFSKTPFLERNTVSLKLHSTQDMKKLASSCKYGAYLGTTWRYQFACWLMNQSIINRLLGEDDGLTHSRAFKIAQTMERASKDTAEL